MYLQTSRLQYNLQKVGVFQTAHSDKKYSSRGLLGLLYHKSTDRSSWLPFIFIQKSIDKMRNLLYNINMQQVVYRRRYNEK